MPDAQPAPDAMAMTITADVIFLVVIRRFVRVAGSQAGLADSALDDLEHAVDELSANIILHGYRGAPGQIDIHCQREGEAFTVILRDQAPTFDPTTMSDPDLDVPLEQRGVGGLGIYLSRKMLDDMRYRRLPAGGNELTLVKRAVRAA
jgi:serine/threonine-protein kinase RsbW